MFACSSVPVGVVVVVVVAVKRIKLIKVSQLATSIHAMPLNVNALTANASQMGWFLLLTLVGVRARG